MGGKIINNPIRSVANPGKINSNAANVSAAPEMISYIDPFHVSRHQTHDARIEQA